MTDSTESFTEQPSPYRVKRRAQIGVGFALLAASVLLFHFSGVVSLSDVFFQTTIVIGASASVIGIRYAVTYHRLRTSGLATQWSDSDRKWP